MARLHRAGDAAGVRPVSVRDEREEPPAAGRTAAVRGSTVRLYPSLGSERCRLRPRDRRGVFPFHSVGSNNFFLAKCKGGERIVTAELSDAPYRRKCGDYGGERKDGRPCELPPAHGRKDADTGRCSLHVDQGPPRGAVVGSIGEPDGGFTPPPGHLSDMAADIWREVVARYLVEIEGLPLLEKALTQYDRARQARREIEENGLTWTNPDSGAVHVNPAVKVERDATKAFRLAWKELALDIETEDL